MIAADPAGVDPTEETDAPPKALLIAAVALAATAVIAILAVAVQRQATPPEQPVAIATIPAPDAEGPDCRALFDALPEQLGDYERAPTVEPTPAGAAAWRADADGEPVIARCGLDRPADFVVGVPLQVVDPVQWFRVAEGERSTWYAVDRPVYVALTLPADSGPTPIQQLSEVIANTLPETEIDPGPPQ